MAKRKGKPGQPTRLNAAVEAAIVEHIRAGNFFEVAAELAGIPRDTATEWRKRGRGTHERSAAPVYVHFAKVCEAALDYAESKNVECLRKAAEGGHRYTENRLKTLVDKEGKNLAVLERVATEHVTPPDVRAAMYWLERARPHRWGNRMKISGDAANPIPVQIVVPAPPTTVPPAAQVKVG